MLSISLLVREIKLPDETSASVIVFSIWQRLAELILRLLIKAALQGTVLCAPTTSASTHSESDVIYEIAHRRR